MNFYRIVILSLLSFGLSVSAMSDNNHSSIHIMDGWARLSPPGAPSAGFMMIRNMAKESDVLLSVSGNFAKKIELHKSSEMDGMMKMKHQKEGVEIPAGGEVEFKPGDYHLMIMGLNSPAKKGDIYQMTLTFRDAGEVVVDFPVMEMKMPETMNH